MSTGNNGVVMEKRRRRRGNNSGKKKNGGGGDQNDNNNDDDDDNSHHAHSSSLLIQLYNPQDGSQIPWYEYGNNVAGRNATIVTNPPPSKKSKKKRALLGHDNNVMIDRYRTQADALYRNQIQIFNSQKKSTSDERWVESTLHKGTLKDRVAAMAVLVSNNPIYKLYALDGLLQMAGCYHYGSSGGGGNGATKVEKSTTTNSRVAQMAAEALEDLFINTLLPSDRKLHTLGQRPLYLYAEDNTTALSLSPRLLLLWRYEEMLHQRFVAFIEQYYVRTLRDGLELDKVFCLRSAASLLKSVPEGESMLLQLLVDKLGDPNKKVAANAGHQLRVVLYDHPAMQTVIAREVQQLTHRPNLSHRALYNAIIFLNQLKLTKEEDDDSDNDSDDNEDASSSAKASSNSLAASLMSTYFRLFEVAVLANNNSNNIKTIDKKMGGGGNKKQKKKNNKHSHSHNNNVVDDEEMMAMKSRLLSALLTGVNRAHPYLPKHHQSLDHHIDTIYRVVHTSPPATSTQALLLLFHAIVAVNNVGNDNNDDDDDSDAEEDNNDLGLSSSDPEQIKKRERFYRALYSTLSVSMLGSGKHLTMYFNLFYKAMKYDTDTTRVVAFTKRLLSTSLQCNPTVTASSIFLVNEICKYHPILNTCGCEVMQRGKDAFRVLDYSKREPRGALVVAASSTSASSTNTTPSSNQDRSNKMNADMIESLSKNKSAPLWELALTKHHFHPSVVKFTSMYGSEIKYTGDPLRDFALTPFLDKFAYRNPKSSERIAQPGGSSSVADRRRDKRANALTAPVNDPSFWAQHQEEVDAQDEFFHKFFVERARRDTIKGIVRTNNKAQQDLDSDDDDDSGGALDAAETGMMGKKFEDFEDQWGDTDSEEEEFVENLMEKVIEDSIQAGPTAEMLDDEDPDMEDWSDMDDDDDDDDNDDDEEEEEFENLELHQNDDAASGEGEEDSNEDDSFMDDDSDNDDDDDMLLDGENRVTSFADLRGGGDDKGDSDGSSSDDSGSSVEEGGSMDDDSADEDDLALLDDEEDIEGSDSEEDKGENQASKATKEKKNRKNKKAATSIFASMEEYEDRINESFNTLKRPTNFDQESEEDEEDDKNEKKTKKKHENEAKKRRKTSS